MAKELRLRRMAAELKETKDALWQEELAVLMRKLRRTSHDVVKDKRSASWKVALAATMKPDPPPPIIGWVKILIGVRSTKSAANLGYVLGGEFHEKIGQPLTTKHDLFIHTR